jgi:hypothetical protein
VSETEFVECDTCRAKPGSPRLCSGCLANRQAISSLRSLLGAEEILEALASDRLVELRNYGDKWAILYRTGHGGERGEITSADFDNLLTVWVGTLRRWELPDEGVEEQTAGLPHNDPNEIAYLPQSR